VEVEDDAVVVDPVPPLPLTIRPADAAKVRALPPRLRVRRVGFAERDIRGAPSLRIEREWPREGLGNGIHLRARHEVSL
jgi:hypothetical protein